MGLILNRRCGESLRIGNDILIEVGEISGGEVELHVSAPPGSAVAIVDADPDFPGVTPRKRARPTRRRSSTEPDIEFRRPRRPKRDKT